MVNYCCVYGCGRNNKSNDRLSFYSLPKEKDRRIAWLKVAGREDLIKSLDEVNVKNKSHRFCSRHFTPSNVKNKSRHLADDVVPTLFLPGQWDAEKSDDEHADIVCNSCNKSVVGFRYKCVTCDDFDLCQKCENMEVHHQHFMLRIPKPLKFKLADSLIKKWRKLFRAEHVTPDELQSDLGQTEDSSDDDEPITKYAKNYDSGVDLSDDVKEQIRKEIQRVTNLKLDQPNKNKKPTKVLKKKEEKKRQATEDTIAERVVNPSKRMKVEEGLKDSFVVEVTPEVVFADVNDIKEQQANDLKTERVEYPNSMPIISSVCSTEGSTLQLPSTSNTAPYITSNPASVEPAVYPAVTTPDLPEASMQPVMHVKLSDDLTELMIEVTSNNQRTIYKYPDSGTVNINNMNSDGC